MALTQSILKEKVTLDRDASGNPVFAWQDTTDYTGNSVTVTDVKVALKIEYSVDGTFTTYYDNLSLIATDPDIDGSTAGQANEDLTRARTQGTPILLPTDAAGNVISSTYRFTHTVTDGTQIVTNVVSVDCAFSLPNGSLAGEVDLTPTSPSIVLTDQSNYVVNNITPTGTPTIYLYFPANVGTPAVSTTGDSLTVTTFYTGTQVGELSAVKTWDYTSKIDTTATNDYTSGNFTIFIEDTVTATTQVVVETNTNICNLFCCLSDFTNELIAAQSDPIKYQKLSAIAGQVAIIYNSIDAAYQCSSTQNVNLWVAQIRDLVGCTEDCECNDGEPVQISGIASGSLVLGNVISFVTSGTTSSYSNNALNGKVYSATQQNFLFFADGLKVTGTFSGTTFTPDYALPTGVQVEILILR